MKNRRMKRLGRNHLTITQIRDRNYFAERNEKIHDVYELTGSFAETGRRFNLSRQRIRQILYPN